MSNDFYCCLPFTRMHFEASSATPCCRGWLDTLVNFDKGADPADIWNCSEMQVLRGSVLDGSYKFCQHCTMYRARRRIGRRAEQHKEIMSHGPSMVMFSNDRTCNLRCFICVHGSELRKSECSGQEVNSDAYEFQKLTIQSFHANLRFLALCAGGDPFAKHSSHRLLMEKDLTVEKYPKLSLLPFTNGLLLPEFWDQSEHLASGRVGRIDVSIDAATKETYEKIRCPGKWEQLQLALEFLNQKRREFGFSLVLHMTVFSWNWQEIPQFVKMARMFGAVTVLQALHDSDGIIPASEYQELAVHWPSHPEYEEFLKVLHSVESNLDVDANLVLHPVQPEDEL